MKIPIWDRAVLDAHRLVTRAQRCQFYQFCDPFDNYNTASQIYELVNGTAPTYSTAYRRFAPPSGLPGQGIKFASGGFNYVGKNMKSNQATFIIKVAVSFPSLGIGTNGAPFLAVTDGGGGFGSVQWCLTSFASGAIGVIRGINSGALIAQTGPGAIAAGSYPTIEVMGTVAASGAACQIWVNGFQVLNATGLNMQATGNAYGNQIWLGDLDNRFGGGVWADDFRVWDNTGSTQNAPLGTDSRLVTKLGSGAGAFTGFTPNGAAANWQCTSDNPPDEDTTYVSASVASTQDAYAVPSAGFTVAPSMVVARSRARKDDGAARTLQIGVSSSGVNGAGGGTYTMGSSYAFIDGLIGQDPNTVAPWTAAGADAAQPWKNELS